jgi:hypothetical protein
MGSKVEKHGFLQVSKVEKHGFLQVSKVKNALYTSEYQVQKMWTNQIEEP